MEILEVSHYFRIEIQNIHKDLKTALKKLKKVNFENGAGEDG